MKSKTLGSADKNGRRRGRRCGTARLFVLGAAFMTSTTVSAGRLEAASASERLGTTPHAQALSGAVAAQSERTVRVDIPAGPLSDVLKAFEQVAGVKVTLAFDAIGTIQSPGVSGLLTSERALRELLMGTAVVFRFTTATQAVLELQAQSESVEVTAGPPTVQSPKYSVPLRDIAQTIAVVPREVFEEQGAATLSDVLRNVPGITLQAGEGGGASNTAGDMFNMRGFNASNSLFVDGVRDDGLISRDAFNLEPVEVFLGQLGPMSAAERPRAT